MTKLEQMLNEAASVVILGHVNPDGDCICLLYTSDAADD